MKLSMVKDRDEAPKSYILLSSSLWTLKMCSTQQGGTRGGSGQDRRTKLYSEPRVLHRRRRTDVGYKVTIGIPQGFVLGSLRRGTQTSPF